MEPVSARFSRIIGTFGPASGHHNVAFVCRKSFVSSAECSCSRPFLLLSFTSPSSLEQSRRAKCSRLCRAVFHSDPLSSRNRERNRRTGPGACFSTQKYRRRFISSGRRGGGAVLEAFARHPSTSRVGTVISSDPYLWFISWAYTLHFSFVSFVIYMLIRRCGFR